MTLILAPFPEMTGLARHLAPLIGAEIRPVDLHQFPDGESLVKLAGDYQDAEVAFVATLRDPDRLALPLRFAAATACELGARRVGLFAPYLGYMRQDRRFHAGEAVSARLFARFLQESFDWLITADPHLHRNPSLDRLFSIPAIRTVTAPLLASWIAANVPDAFILGPDSESKQWVADVARIANRPYEVLEKVRSGDRQVQISPPDNPGVTTGTPVIIDDIASSGRTLIRAIEKLTERGASPPVCVVIHAVFSGSALADILAAGAKTIVTTDSIPHPTNAIPLSRLFAETYLNLQKTFDPPAPEGRRFSAFTKERGRTDD